MNLPKIGWATSIAAYNLIRTIMHGHLTFQCWGTSKRCYKNTNIVSHQNCNIVLIPRHQTVRCKSTRTSPCQHFPQVVIRENQRNTMRHWQLFILCLRHQHHSADGSQLHCNQANKGDNKQYGKSQTTPQLFGNKP